MILSCCTVALLQAIRQARSRGRLAGQVALKTTAPTISLESFAAKCANMNMDKTAAACIPDISLVSSALYFSLSRYAGETVPSCSQFRSGDLCRWTWAIFALGDVLLVCIITERLAGSAGAPAALGAIILIEIY